MVDNKEVALRAQCLQNRTPKHNKNRKEAFVCPPKHTHLLL